MKHKEEIIIRKVLENEGKIDGVDSRWSECGILSFFFNVDCEQSSIKNNERGKENYDDLTFNLN